MSNDLTPDELVEFRQLYNKFFGGNLKAEITTKVKTDPLFNRYEELAPRFYVQMLRGRRKY